MIIDIGMVGVHDIKIPIKYVASHYPPALIGYFLRWQFRHFYIWDVNQ